MINFGSFSEGYNENERILAAKRKENAALYSDFVKSNPGASADEREKFANSLAGNNKSFRAILPSREMMESNVAEYNRKQAAARAARARKQQLEDLKIAKDASTYMADLLQTSDAETASKMVGDMYGDLLNPDLMPAVSAQANRIGWAKFQQDAAPLIQNFQNNPTQANLDSLARAGYNEGWGAQLRDQYAPVLDRAKKQAEATARASIMNIAQKVDLDDDNVFTSQTDAEFAKYDGLLSEAEKNAIVEQGLKQIQNRKTVRASEAEALLNTTTQAMLARVGEDGYQTVDQLKTQIDLAIASDPRMAGVSPTDSYGLLEDALNDQREVELEEINNTEEAKILEATQTALSNRGYTEDNYETIKNQVRQFVTVDPEGKNQSTLRNADIDQLTGEVSTQITNLGAFGINVNDKDFVGSLTRRALDLRNRTEGATGEAETVLDITHFAQAMDEMLLTNNGAINPIERAAMQRVLADKGLSSIAEVVKRGDTSFSAAVEAELRDMVREQHDLFDRTDTTLKSVANSINSEVQAFDEKIDALNIDDIISQAGQYADVEVSRQKVDDIKEWGKGATQAVTTLMASASEIDAQANRLEQLSQHEYYGRNREAVKNARSEALKLRKKAESLRDQAEGVADQILSLQDRVKIASSGNVPSDNPTNLNTAVANYASEVSDYIDAAESENRQVKPEQLFQLIVSMVERNPALVPTIQYKGSEGNRTATGEVPFSIFRGRDENNFLDRAFSGGTEIKDYETVVRMVYEQLRQEGYDMPTATQMRQALGSRTATEFTQDTVGGAAKTIGDRFNYAFPNFNLFENAFVDEDGNFR